MYYFLSSLTVWRDLNGCSMRMRRPFTKGISRCIDARKMYCATKVIVNWLFKTSMSYSLELPLFHDIVRNFHTELLRWIVQAMEIFFCSWNHFFYNATVSRFLFFPSFCATLKNWEEFIIKNQVNTKVLRCSIGASPTNVPSHS